MSRLWGKCWTEIQILLTWEMAEEFARSESTIRWFVSFVNPIAGLQDSTVKLQIVGTAYFMNASRRVQKTHYRFWSKLSSVKSSLQTPAYFEVVKHSLFISISHSLLSFGSWVNLKVLTLDFVWFSSEIYCGLETTTVSNFPQFLSSPTVTS